MNRKLARAAREAKAFTGSDGPIDWQAVRDSEAAMTAMEAPMLCPCCGLLWDTAEARRLLTAGDEAGYLAWLRATLALPGNRVGDMLGTRGQPITLAMLDEA